MTKVSLLTAQAQADMLKFQQNNGYLNDVRLESFGFFLDDYVIRGGELTIEDKKIIVSEGIISFNNQLWRVFVDEFRLKNINTTYYVGFKETQGYLIGETEPSEGYLRLWSIPINASGVIGTPIDHRTLLEKVKFKAQYDEGVFLSSHKITVSTAEPTPEQGQEHELWFKYE